MELSIIETRTVETVRVHYNGKIIIFHSKYDPLNEAEVWAEKVLAAVNDQETVIVVGIGAGYHIQQLAKKMPDRRIVVIEFNDFFYKWFENSPFYEPLTHYAYIELRSFTELSAIERDELFTNIHSSNICIHKSGLDIMPEHYKGIQGALNDLSYQQHSLRNQLDNLKKNFEKNQRLQDQGIQDLKNSYIGKPMIVVSAGPSLNKLLPLLKKMRNDGHFVIGAVGTAIKPLLKAAIVPDFFAIIDPNPATYSQLTDVVLPNTPLFYLSTAYHETILLHKGPRYRVYQEGYADAERLARQHNEPLIRTGGSVATALLDMMVYLGGESIALVGQDLAYTDGISHTEGAHAWQEVKESLNAMTVLNYDRTGVVQTANNLTLYRKWFERYAKNNPMLALYNCTEGGAYIKNWQHIPLNQYYMMYNSHD